MVKPVGSRGPDARKAFGRLDEIASGSGALARFWRAYGKNTAKKARGEARNLDDHLEFALAAYDAQRLPAEAVTFFVLYIIDTKAVEPHVEKVYSQDFYERYEAIRRAFGLGKDEYWAPGEAPAESQALDAEFEQAEGRIRTEILSLYARKTGHPLLKEIADLSRSDPLVLENRRDLGQQQLLGLPGTEAAAHLRAKGSVEETGEKT